MPITVTQCGTQNLIGAVWSNRGHIGLGMWKCRFQAQQCALFKWSFIFLWKKILNGSKIKSKFLHCDKRSFCPWPWGLEDISLALLCLCLSAWDNEFVGLKRYVHLESMSIFEIILKVSGIQVSVLLIQMDMTPFSRTPQSFTLHWSYMRPLPTPRKSFPQMLCSCGVCWFFSAGISSQLSYFLICQSEWIASTTYVLYLCAVVWLLRL